MALRLYLDHRVPRAIALGLRLRNVDVVTAAEDGAAEMDDSALMDRASELGRLLVTFDNDLLAEADRRQQANQSFSGLVFAHPLRVPVGVCVKDLELIAKSGGPDDVRNSVLFLPL
jgi:hypothetical protein